MSKRHRLHSPSPCTAKEVSQPFCHTSSSVTNAKMSNFSHHQQFLASVSSSTVFGTTRVTLAPPPRREFTLPRWTPSVPTRGSSTRQSTSTRREQTCNVPTHQAGMSLADSSGSQETLVEPVEALRAEKSLGTPSPADSCCGPTEVSFQVAAAGTISPRAPHVYGADDFLTVLAPLFVPYRSEQQRSEPLGYSTLDSTSTMSNATDPSRRAPSRS